MADIMDYMEWRGDVTFDMIPVNEVDGLIFSQFAYIPLEGVIDDMSGEMSVLEAGNRFFDIHSEEEIRGYTELLKNCCRVFKGMMNCDRFKNLKIKYYHADFDPEISKQFGAVTIVIHDDLYYVAFRGTDDSLAGWEEDFKACYTMPVEAQVEAESYLGRIFNDYDGKIYIGGHSKGGNLAVYSAMKCAPFVQKRIQKIYSLDGPGFRPEVLKECHYNAIEGKVVKLLPHSSMIGMIFERDIHYRVVESNSHGLLQHDPFSWLVEEDHFVDVDDIYESQKIMNEALNEWILSLNEEQVRTFVETLYQVISASQADDLITFTADWKKSMNAVVTALKEVDAQTAEMLRGIIRSLFEIAKVKVREELAPAKKPGRRFRNKKKEEKAEAHRPVPEDAPDATAAQGSAARHAPRLRGSRHRGSAE